MRPFNFKDWENLERPNVYAGKPNFTNLYKGNIVKNLQIITLENGEKRLLGLLTGFKIGMGYKELEKSWNMDGVSQDGNNLMMDDKNG
jgi:hypothetical protein